MQYYDVPLIIGLFITNQSIKRRYGEKKRLSTVDDSLFFSYVYAISIR